MIDVLGKPRDGRTFGRVPIGVGCGAHTPYEADLVQAEPSLALKAFRERLVAGKVAER